MSDLIEAGDIIYHSLTAEKLYVLGVNHETGKLCIAGHPPAVLDIVNSFLYSKGIGITEKEVEYRNEQFGGGWE